VLYEAGIVVARLVYRPTAAEDETGQVP
jgi:Sec-independent protein secretion pathway component TatC